MKKENLENYNRFAKISKTVGLLCAMVILTLAMSNLTAQAQNFNNVGGNNWRLFSPPGESFTVRMPGKTASQRDSQYVVIYHSVMETPQGVHFYGIGTDDNPAYNSAKIDDVLNKQISEFAAGFKGKVVEQRARAFKTFPAKEAIIESNENHAYVITFKVDKRYYVLCFAKRKGGGFPVEAPRFIDSFSPVGQN